MRLTRYSTVGCLALALIVAASAAMPLLAHHSFAAEYDSKQPVTMKGAVTKIEWMNPHVYFYIDVKNEETGKVENWGWEMGAPAVIQRTGWTKNSMKIGDLVIVEGTKAKGGTNHGNARSVTMASTGKKLGAGSSEGQYPEQ